MSAINSVTATSASTSTGSAAGVAQLSITHKYPRD